MICTLAYVDEGMYQIAMALLLACTFFSVFFLTMHISKLTKRLQAIETFLKQTIEKPKNSKKKSPLEPDHKSGKNSAALEDPEMLPSRRSKLDPSSADDSTDSPEEPEAEPDDKDDRDS